MKFVFVLLCVVKILEAAKYSNTFTKCKRTGPDTDECLRKAIEDAFLQQICIKGIPELGVSNFNPPPASSFSFKAEGNSLNLVQTYYDMKVYGLCDGRITKAHFNDAEKVLSFTYFSPKLDYIAKYSYEGNVMMLQLRASGNCNLTNINITIDHKIQFEEKTLGGEEYFRVKSYDVNIEITDVNFQIDHLFGNNKVLSDAFLVVLNENWKVVWEGTKPTLEQKHIDRYMKVANLIFGAIPVSQIFLD